MSMMSWHETLARQNAQGTLFNTYTAAKTVINPTGLLTVPANYLDVGRVLRVRVLGAISNIVTTPGTVAFQVMIAGVIAFTTGNLQMSSTAHTLVPFWLDIALTVRSIGSGTNAKFIGQAIMHSQAINATAVADGTQTHSMLMAPNSSPAVGTGFDSTISNIMDLFVGFSISNAGNGVQIEQYSVIAEY